MNNEFTEPNDELKRVAEEINLIRRDIQTASAALGRIERRLKAAFPNYPSKQTQLKEKKKTGKIQSSKTSQELQAIFEGLVTRTQSGGDSAFAALIGEFKDEDIIALAVEVGIGSPSRLSRQKAIDGVRKRVQEAMQLQFENRQAPKRGTEGDGFL
jgi:hypothetical protein